MLLSRLKSFCRLFISNHIISLSPFILEFFILFNLIYRFTLFLYLFCLSKIVSYWSLTLHKALSC